jgi:uncharacterized protein YidB (DUF937 family)
LIVPSAGGRRERNPARAVPQLAVGFADCHFPVAMKARLFVVRDALQEAPMGLLDILNGMQNGPRGQTDPNAKGGMSPITMAILALIAYKGYKHLSGGQQAPSTPASPRLPDRNNMDADTGAPGGGLGDILGGLLGGGRGGAFGNAPGGAGGGGGLGDLLKGGLGGALAGGAAGSILSGGLGSLLEQFQRNGQGQAAQSWVGKGPNQDISESDLAKSIGIDDIDTVASQTGLSRDELLSGLRRELPQAVDELTPEGRLPTEQEASRWV